MSLPGLGKDANGTIHFLFNGQNYTFIPTNGISGINRDNHTAYGNLTLLADYQELCNRDICDLSLAQLDYRPNLGGNVFFAAVFLIYILIQLFLGIRHKTWGFMIAVVLGLIGEVVGYAGRILLWHNVFDPTGNYFLIYLVSLTIAPAFLSAGIYLCLSRIVVVYGQHLSRFRPGTYTLIFCGCDLFSLVLQGLGGGIAASADKQSSIDTGIDIMLAGLGFQVFSIGLFAAICADFAFRLHKNRTSWADRHADLQESKFFISFLIGLCVATLCIFVRSVFRVAELSEGFRGALANDEVTFMILEGAMIVIATSCLTFLHPGVAFRGIWSQVNFTFRGGAIEDGVTKSGGTTPYSMELTSPENQPK
ncbi:RTA1 like protein-domain-containing protein [Xylogone sp. PMI_703]|nr:RTA1 like protein-domain-containing protein [Xylogone sp. PMI_703]